MLLTSAPHFDKQFFSYGYIFVVIIIFLVLTRHFLMLKLLLVVCNAMAALHSAFCCHN